MTIPNVLSIAGSDPGGGAGIQADLKTFGALGCHGMAAITALTAQNTVEVTGIHVPPASFLAQQIDAVFADIDVSAVKIGMLANAANAACVGECLRRYTPPIVVLDPVLIATSGDSLATPDLAAAVRRLMPQATLLTPNLAEAARLADLPPARTVAEMSVTAERLHALGARAVLVKGGHLDGETSVDVLFDGDLKTFEGPRIATRNTHGTGCTLASAIAAFLAHGADLREAVAQAKVFLVAALVSSDVLHVGHGPGPVNHFHAQRR